jgi:hypothetical protein
MSNKQTEQFEEARREQEEENKPKLMSEVWDEFWNQLLNS